MDNLTSVLDVVLVTGAGDPAFNRAHPKYATLATAYARTRSPEDLAALMECCHDGRKPWVFRVSPLSVFAAEWTTNGTAPSDVSRYNRAFLASCFTVVDPQGNQIDAPRTTRPGDDEQVAATAWADTVARKLGRGMGAIREVGAVALQRAEVPADAVGFYWPLPGGLRLAL